MGREWGMRRRGEERGGDDEPGLAEPPQFPRAIRDGPARTGSLQSADRAFVRRTNAAFRPWARLRRCRGVFVLVLSSSPPAHARQKLQSPEWRSCSALHANSLIKSPTDQPHRPWLLNRVEDSARRSTGRLEAALYGGDILGGLRDCVNPLSCVYRFSAYLLHIVFFVSHSSYSLLKPAPTIHSLPADHLV